MSIFPKKLANPGGKQSVSLPQGNVLAVTADIRSVVEHDGADTDLLALAARLQRGLAIPVSQGLVSPQLLEELDALTKMMHVARDLGSMAEHLGAAGISRVTVPERLAEPLLAVQRALQANNPEGLVRSAVGVGDPACPPMNPSEISLMRRLVQQVGGSAGGGADAPQLGYDFSLYRGISFTSGQEKQLCALFARWPWRVDVDVNGSEFSFSRVVPDRIDARKSVVEPVTVSLLPKTLPRISKKTGKLKIPEQSPVITEVKRLSSQFDIVVGLIRSSASRTEDASPNPQGRSLKDLAEALHGVGRSVHLTSMLDVYQPRTMEAFVEALRKTMQQALFVFFEGVLEPLPIQDMQPTQPDSPSSFYPLFSLITGRALLVHFGMNGEFPFPEFLPVGSCMPTQQELLVRFVRWVSGAFDSAIGTGCPEVGFRAELRTTLLDLVLPNGDHYKACLALPGQTRVALVLKLFEGVETFGWQRIEGGSLDITIERALTPLILQLPDCDPALQQRYWRVMAELARKKHDYGAAITCMTSQQNAMIANLEAQEVASPELALYLCQAFFGTVSNQCGVYLAFLQSVILDKGFKEFHRKTNLVTGLAQALMEIVHSVETQMTAPVLKNDGIVEPLEMSQHLSGLGKALHQVLSLLPQPRTPGHQELVTAVRCFVDVMGDCCDRHKIAWEGLSDVRALLETLVKEPVPAEAAASALRPLTDEELGSLFPIKERRARPDRPPGLPVPVESAAAAAAEAGSPTPPSSPVEAPNPSEYVTMPDGRAAFVVGPSALDLKIKEVFPEEDNPVRRAYALMQAKNYKQALEAVDKARGQAVEPRYVVFHNMVCHWISADCHFYLINTILTDRFLQRPNFQGLVEIWDHFNKHCCAIEALGNQMSCFEPNLMQAIGICVEHYKGSTKIGTVLSHLNEWKERILVESLRIEKATLVLREQRSNIKTPYRELSGDVLYKIEAARVRRAMVTLVAQSDVSQTTQILHDGYDLILAHNIPRDV